MQSHEPVPGTTSGQSCIMDTRHSDINSIAIQGTVNTTMQARPSQGTAQAPEARKEGSASQDPWRQLGLRCGEERRGGRLQRHDLEVVKLAIWADDWPFPRLMATGAYLSPLLRAFRTMRCPLSWSDEGVAREVCRLRIHPAKNVAPLG